jgi:serine/threonine protein kinase
VYNKLLGEGSFSKVYLGENKKTKKLVAIKEVKKLEEN